MTIEELYGKVLADEDLKQSLAKAVEEGNVAQWAAAQGVEVSEEELLAYAEAAAAESGELSDEELEKVAGGGYGTGVKSAVLVVLLYNFYNPDNC